MGWKILSLFLAIIIAVLYYTGNGVKTQLSQSQTNERALAGTINGIAERYPVFITAIDFINTDYQKKTLGRGRRFDKTGLRYLAPKITYKRLQASASKITLYCKMFSPSGELKHNSDSPYGYTYKYTIDVSSDSGEQFATLPGWGNGRFSTYAYGLHKVEIWYNYNCLYTGYFDIY